MDAAITVESTLTDRYQTTVPGEVRRALKLNKRDRICYVVQRDGSVIMRRVVDPEADDQEDPVLGKFLNFLARDIADNPDDVRPLGASLRARIRALTGSRRKIDFDAALNPEDE